MISLPLAQQLKQAGLVWKAGNHDFFAIPDRGLDDRVFVIADIMANLDLLRGWPVITFHGTAEWALDYIITSEAVWMPTEEQLRQELERLLKDQSDRNLALNHDGERYYCQIQYRAENLSINGANASEAYGQTILYILQNYHA